MLESRAEKYTAKEFHDFLSKDKTNARYELIDGHVYMMTSPSVNHQSISLFICDVFNSYFKENDCRLFYAPLDVYLFDNIDDCKNVCQPDLLVVCDKNKIKSNGIYGAPDLVVEIISKTTASIDYILKYKNYMKYGVKEYWIVDYGNDEITVCTSIEDYISYGFSETVPSSFFPGLTVDFSEFKSDF